MAKISTTVKEWFSKANDDLIGARSLWATNNKRVWLLVGFLCQQACEKALKGFLLFNGKKVQKIHSIDELSKDVLILAPDLKDLLAEATMLTPYAVRFRYPSAEAQGVDEEDIRKALNLAEKVVSECARRISPDTPLGV